jgi:hypothetical protein
MINPLLINVIVSPAANPDMVNPALAVSVE